MMLVWNNLADPHLSAFSDFAWFSQTVTLNTNSYNLLYIRLTIKNLIGREHSINSQ